MDVSLHDSQITTQLMWFYSVLKTMIPKPEQKLGEPFSWVGESIALSPTLLLGHHVGTKLLCCPNPFNLLPYIVSGENLVSYHDQNLAVNCQLVGWESTLPAHFLPPRSCQFPMPHILDLSPIVLESERSSAWTYTNLPEILMSTLTTV